MKKLVQLYILFLLLLSSFTYAQNIDSLRQKLYEIVKSKNAVVGIAIQGYDEKDTLSINGDLKFPLQSVFKFHIALAVLKNVDEGKLNLNKNIEITREDLNSDLYSPIRDQYPSGVNMKLSEIIRYTVAESDNIGCDLLLKIIGGPEIVEKYLHENNIEDIAIKYDEKTQQSKWENQYENWATPKSANLALLNFYQNQNGLLSKDSYSFLWETMKNTKTGQKSIRGKLPPKTVIAHKTGHSGKNKDGMTGALNDIGIVFLSKEKYFYLSVFVSNSKEDEEKNQKIIADVAKLVWEYFVQKYA